ncbi:carbohydrate-binding protein [Streptomyces sp. 796.1]|uniref:carbohydrate-binding protein n=1 Tax=Streptomyces sp. 796.1 TaxID=3163029 RepID=UPI0039C91DEB
MTAGNNGSGVPQDDDPFAYLYRQEGGEAGADQGAQGTPRTGGYGYPGPPQPGVPRTSYNHVRAVGERQYGQQQQHQQHHQQAAPGGYGYGQQQSPQQQQQHGHYTAPEALPTQTWNRVQGPPPGGVPPRQQAPGGPGHGAPAGRGGGGRGPNSKGLLIGAIAVVAVVIVAISVAMISNNTGGKKDDKAEPTKDAQPTASETVEPSNTPKATKGPAPLPTEDASAMKLEGGTTLASDVPGAKADGGKYVAGINKPGAAATWTVDVEESGQYRLYVGYGVPGEDQNLSLTVNSKRDPRAVSMKNFALAKKGDWEAGWTNTWAIVNLNKGTNTVRLSCESGNKCDVNLDRVWLTKG